MKIASPSPFLLYSHQPRKRGILNCFKILYERWQEFVMNLHLPKIMSQFPNGGRAADPALLIRSQCSLYDITQHFRLNWVVQVMSVLEVQVLTFLLPLCLLQTSRRFSSRSQLDLVKWGELENRPVQIKQKFL